MGEIAALGWALLFSLSTVFMRFGSSRLNLFWLNALRCMFAMITAAVVLLATGGPGGLLNMPLPTLFWLVVATFLTYPIGDTIYFRSGQLIGVSRAMPLSNSYPLVSVVLAVSLLGESASWRLAAGTGLILVGAYYVASPRGRPVAVAKDLLDSDGRKGASLAILAAFFWGLGVICDRLAMMEASVDLTAAAFLRLSLGTFFLFSLAGSRGWDVNWGKLSPKFILLIALVGGVTGAGMPILWLFAVQNAGAAKASLLTATAPLFGMALSAALLKERLDRRTIAGGVLTILGVWLIL